VFRGRGLPLTRYDGVVVGSGPNGLAAAITLARAGRSVLVVEANDTLGGGTRSAALTLPGLVHDLCSAVHPMAAASPVFAEWPLREHGLEWIEPPLALAHPLDDGDAVVVARDLAATVAGLGDDGEAYRNLIGPVATDWPVIVPRPDGQPEAWLRRRLPHARVAPAPGPTCWNRAVLALIDSFARS